MPTQDPTQQENAAEQPEAATEQPEAAATEQAAAGEHAQQYIEADEDELHEIIKHHVWVAMGVGLVPLPLVDLVAVSSVQLNMLRKIAKAYHVPFLRDSVKNVLSSLLGAALPITLAPRVAASLTKLIPGVGQTVGVITMPILSGASTYAVGKVFVQHFASGGTFLTFDPHKVKGFYEEMFKEGQQVAAEMNSKQAAPKEKK